MPTWMQHLQLTGGIWAGSSLPLEQEEGSGSPLFLPEHPIMGPWSTFMEQRGEPLRANTKHPFDLKPGMVYKALSHSSL